MTSSLKFDQLALGRLFDSPSGPVAKDLVRRAVTVDRTAKRLCPVDTGRLRASINHTLEADNRGLVAFIGTNTDYAAHVEFGTRYMRAQPFLRPALRAGAK